MTQPVQRPPIAAVTFAQAGDALDRLISVAGEDHVGAKYAANFLLAWWNGVDWGHFPIVNMCNSDPEPAEDMLIILTFLSQNGVHYADAWGRRADMERLIARWRA